MSKVQDQAKSKSPSNQSKLLLVSLGMALIAIFQAIVRKTLRR